jgi:hypothetical protein
MGTAQILLKSANLTRLQWDAFLAAVNTLITQNPALAITIDKPQSGYTETPP